MDEERTNLSQLYDALLVTINSLRGYTGDLSESFLDQRHEFILQATHLEKSLQYILRMIYPLLNEADWAGGGKLTELAHRRIPAMVKEFETFLPNEANYNTPTGHVRFINGMIHREYAIQLADDHFHARVGRVRQLLDTEDYGELVANVQAIPGLLARRETYCLWCRKAGHHERDCDNIPRHLAGLGGELPGMDPLDPTGTWGDERDVRYVLSDADTNPPSTWGDDRDVRHVLSDAGTNPPSTWGDDPVARYVLSDANTNPPSTWGDDPVARYVLSDGGTDVVANMWSTPELAELDKGRDSQFVDLGAVREEEMGEEEEDEKTQFVDLSLDAVLEEEMREEKNVPKS